MGFLATLFKDEEPQPAAPKVGINAILLGPPGSGKGTQVSASQCRMNGMTMLRSDLLCICVYYVRMCVCCVPGVRTSASKLV